MTHNRILIVEDEKITALEMAEHLRQHGYEPLGPCASGEEAIASAYTLHPDAILMDIALKGPMDGIEAAEAIRSTCPCPVIYVTAHSDQATLDRAKVTEPFGYVLKPVNERELHIAIEIAMYRAKLEEKLRESEERYRIAIEHSNDGVVITREGRYVYVNQRFLDLFGYDGPEEVLGTSVGDARHVHPEDREKVAEIVRRRQAREATPARYDYRAIHKDGRELDVEVSAASIVYQGEPSLLSYLRDITERKKAEEALHRSETKFRTLFDSTSDAVMLLDENGFFECNKATLAVFGCATQEEFCSKHPSDVSPPEQPCGTDSRMLANQRIATATERGSHRFEWMHKRADIEESFPADVLLNAMELDGKPILQAVVRDITERKRADKALEHERSNLQAIFDAAQVGMLLIDENGAVTRVNQVATQLVGKDAAAMLSRQPGDGLCCIHAASVAEGCGHAEACPKCPIRNTFSAVLRTGETVRGVEAATRLIINGEERTFYFSISASPIVLNGGNHVLLAISDITDLKFQEGLLRESESRMRAITDSAQDAILMMDPEGRISYWNPAAERVFGYTSAEAIGQQLHVFIVPQRYHEAHCVAFPAFLQTGQGAAVGNTLDLDARRKDGREIAVQLSLSALNMNGGWHAVGLIRDITDRKRQEIELTRSRDELEQANRHLEEATARANEMAAQADMANAAKSDFLANMSHEIRTPMNGVIGMTGLLLDTDLDEDQRRYAEIVRTSGESLLALLNDILDFSKIEAGKLELETLDFDLRALLDDFAAMLALRIQEKGLEFICAAAPDVPAFLCGDPGRLRQVLINLTGNAVKFTAKGEIAVRASLVSETDNEAVIRFSVKDTGIGIPAGKQEPLFQKFTQADVSTTRKYGGTGLGLAICKQLTEIMGGEIGVVSEEGEGSEFWFTAHFAKQAEHERNVAPPAEIHGVHVLVVDDNATNREVLTAQLLAWGARMEETSSGPLALQALYRARDAGDPFSVAIIDVQMSGIDGATLARIIKADEKLKDTRLVLFSSLGERGDARRMQEIGFAAYLTKPARYQELKAILSTVLSGTIVAEPEQHLVTRHTIREMRRGAVRILLAEDNITNQQVALGILKKLGLRADAVANGAEAVKALETLPYDLVLMDVQMPEMDGLEATQCIRNPQSAVRNHRIPIIAMTAHAMQGDREKCIEAGMNDYVSKPVSPQALVDVLDTWLPKEPAAATKQAIGKPG